MTTPILPARLRAWARGSYPLEAAVEILVRAHNGRFAAETWPWIETEDGHVWLDAEAINDDTIGALSGGEQRLLRIAASLAGGDPVRLGENVPGMDRDSLELVLAAVAHAGGSHEHREPRFNSDHTAVAGFELQPSLHPWP